MQVCCPHCQAALKLPPDLSASRVRCSVCKEVFGIRTAQPERPPAPAPASTPTPDRGPPPEPPGEHVEAVFRDSEVHAPPAPFESLDDEGRGSGVRKAFGVLSVLLMAALVVAFLFREDLGRSNVSRFRAYIPSGARGVAVLDLERLRATSLYATIEQAAWVLSQNRAPELRAVKIGLADVAEACRIDGADGTSLLVLRTTADRPLAELVAGPAATPLDVREGMQCMAVDVEGTAVHVAKTGPATFCLSPNEAALDAVLRRVSGRDRSDVVHSLRGVLHRVRRFDHCCAGLVGEGAPVRIDSLPAGTVAVALGVTVDDVVHGELVFELADAERARDCVAAMESALNERRESVERSLADAAEAERAALDALHDVLTSARVSQRGAWVCVASSVATHRIQQASQQLIEKFTEDVASVLE